MDTHSLITIPHQAGGLPVYMACPSSESPRPTLVLIHEVWGLTDHIKNIADRLCQEGFNVMAPDLMAGTEVEKVASITMMKKGTKKMPSSQFPLKGT